jgi:hypothetical protein
VITELPRESEFTRKRLGDQACRWSARRPAALRAAAPRRHCLARWESCAFRTWPAGCRSPSEEFRMRSTTKW